MDQDAKFEAAKRLACYQAIDTYVKPEHKYIGIGSGSTVVYLTERLAQEPHAQYNNDRWFIPTGYQSEELIINAGLRLGSLDQFKQLDVAIDGADDVDEHLDCIKGGGACHLQEKLVAEAAKTFVLVADYRKNSKVLGDYFKQGVPIEVATPAADAALAKIRKMNVIQANIRSGKPSKAGPCVTDNANLIIDAAFPPEVMKNTHDLYKKLKLITGVVEVGLFPGMAEAVFFGNPDGSVSIRTRDGNTREIPAQH